MTLPVVLTKRIITGLVLLYLSGIGWVAELIVPVLPVSHKIVIFSLIALIAELCFFAGIALLGKTVYRQLKTWLIQLILSLNRP